MSWDLYEELRGLEWEVQSRWPDSGGFLETIYLPIFDVPIKAIRGDWYFCTPKHAHVFSRAEGGVHFSFVGDKSGVSDFSPIAVTSPSIDGCSYIVGANLREFLRWGCLRGFFGMGYIGSARYQVAFGDPDWFAGKEVLGETIDARSDEWRGFGTQRDLAAEILDLLRTRFDLTPIEDPIRRFKELQAEYGHFVGSSQDAVTGVLGNGRIRRWLRRAFG